MHGQDILCGIAPSNGFAAVVSLQHNMFDYVGYFFFSLLCAFVIISDQNGEFLPLKTSPMKLLQLKSKGEETIVCASISENADKIVYSDQFNLRIFNLDIVSNFSCQNTNKQE